MTDLFDYAHTGKPQTDLSPADAYQAMEVRNHAERTIRAAGRKASPDFLRAIAAEIVAQANARGGGTMTTPTPTSKAFRLGGYSNNPKEHEQEIADRQEAVVIEIGDFLLQKTAQYRHWVARTKDGKPLPRALEGRWLHPDQFRIAAEKYLAGASQRNQAAQGNGRVKNVE